jgi:ABC-2 type transport system permease protein
MPQPSAHPGRHPALRRIRCLLVKDLAQLRRDPRLFGLLLIAPIFQLFVLGYAANTDVREIVMAVRDNDHTFHSREFIRAMGSSGYFKTHLLTGPASSDGEELVSSEAGLVLVIPTGFGRTLVQGHTASVQALVDGANSNFSVQGIGYLQKAARLFSEGLVRVAIRSQGPPGISSLPAVVAQTRVWYNPDLASRLFMVPAIMAQLLMVTTMLVTSMALVKEREEGTLEQLIVTPLRPLEITLGKLLPFVVIGFAELTLIFPPMLLIFHVPFRGNVLLLYALSGLFLLTTLGLGLFISTLVKTQQQAMMVAAFFVMLPFVMLSGFAFPIENMPRVIQAVAHLIPLTYYLIIVRGIFLKGAGWAELWPQALVLLIWGTAILTLAVVKFHKRLD